MSHRLFKSYSQDDGSSVYPLSVDERQHFTNHFWIEKGFPVNVLFYVFLFDTYTNR